MKRLDVVPVLAISAGVFWYLYRQRSQTVAAAAPEPLDYINPASKDFVVNKAFNVIGVDLHGIGQKLGAGLYDLIH